MLKAVPLKIFATKNMERNYQSEVEKLLKSALNKILFYDLLYETLYS